MTCPEHKAAHCGCPGSDSAIYRPPSQPQGAEPPDPPGCVWRGKSMSGKSVAILDTPSGPRATFYLIRGTWMPWESVTVDEAADIFAAAFLSAHSRLAAMTQERESERLISVGHEARADRAEAALQEVRDGIARVMRQTRGGEP